MLRFSSSAFLFICSEFRAKLSDAAKAEIGRRLDKDKRLVDEHTDHTTKIDIIRHALIWARMGIQRNHATAVDIWNNRTQICKPKTVRTFAAKYLPSVPAEVCAAELKRLPIHHHLHTKG